MTAPGWQHFPHEADKGVRRSGRTREAAFEQTGRTFSSARHGAGRSMSRHAAHKRWKGRELTDRLAKAGIIVRPRSARGVADEAPAAYKDAGTVRLAAENAGLARRAARLEPMVCIKG